MKGFCLNSFPCFYSDVVKIVLKWINNQFFSISVCIFNFKLWNVVSQLYVSQIYLEKPYPSRNSIITWAKHNSYIPLFNLDAYFMLEELHLKCSWPISRDWSGHIWHSLPSLEYSHSDLCLMISFGKWPTLSIQKNCLDFFKLQTLL